MKNYRRKFADLFTYCDECNWSAFVGKDGGRVVKAKEGNSIPSFSAFRMTKKSPKSFPDEKHMENFSPVKMERAKCCRKENAVACYRGVVECVCVCVCVKKMQEWNFPKQIDNKNSLEEKRISS